MFPPPIVADKEVLQHVERRSLGGSRRRMVRAELLGQHTHITSNRMRVHIWERDGSYLARGRYEGRPFGQTLGSDPTEAASRLRHLLVSIENGTFVRPSEARRRPLRTTVVPRLGVRELCDAFLAEKRQLRGKGTAKDYFNRVAPLIEFSEEPKSRRRWPLAIEVDHQFAVALRSHLHGRLVGRNGHPAASQRLMSPRQIYNVLDCARTMFAWGKRPDVNKLPSYFMNPFTEDIVGYRPRKDPLRSTSLPQEVRIALVERMDLWQLCHFAIPLVLPLRPEDFTGLLISEVDFDQRVLQFGTRLAGRDFNKCRESFHVPFPPELAPLLLRCTGARIDGPLLCKRTVFEGSVRPQIRVDNTDAISAEFENALVAAGPDEIQCEQDEKRVFRRLLERMGGVSSNALAKEFKRLLGKIGTSSEVRLYDLRGSVTTDMNRAKVSHLLQTYVTGHSMDRDILSQYVSLQLHEEMEGYFRAVEPLLDAIRRRAARLGVPGDETAGPEAAANAESSKEGLAPWHTETIIVMVD